MVSKEELKLCNLEPNYSPEVMYSGKANDLISTNNDSVAVLRFTDRVSAGNGEKKSVIKDKGKNNCAIAQAAFEALEAEGVKTHYLGEVSKNSVTVPNGIYVLKTVPVKLEIIGRFEVADSACKRYHLEEGIKFTEPLIEWSLKNDELGDPFICDLYVVEHNLLKAEEVEPVREMATKVAHILKKFFARFGAELIDFKFEIGRYGDELIVIDEISCDTVRIRDIETGHKLDKDRFRKDMADVALGYNTMGARVIGEQ